MKRILITLTTMATALLLLGTTSITAQAYDWKEHYEKMCAKREQQEKEHMEKWLDELEADGNLTPEAIKAAGKYLYRRGEEPGTGTDQGYYDGTLCIYYAGRFNDPF